MTVFEYNSKVINFLSLFLHAILLLVLQYLSVAVIPSSFQAIDDYQKPRGQQVERELRQADKDKMKRKR